MKNEAEVIATRRTFDGAVIRFHADGCVSFLSYILRGRLPMESIWQVAGDVCLYTSDEIPALVRSVKAGTFSPFRVRVPKYRRDDVSAIYRAIVTSAGVVVNLRIA